MLPTNVFIDSPASIGGGQYTLDLYFSQLALAKYLNVGDYIQDTVSNQYEIVALASSPHTDGSQVTVQFITTATAPAQDSDYNSIVFTPGQEDVRPSGRTEVNIDNAVVFDAQNYEYTVTVTVGSIQESNQMVVGDSIVDLNGKEFELTFIDPTNRFNVACRAKEVHQEGDLPTLGVGSMYQATANVGLFRGTPISDPSRTTVRNRDNFVVDAKFKELEDQISGGGASGSLVTSDFENSTGSAINPLVAVSTNSSGQLKVCDVSDEVDVKAFKGITTALISDAASGPVAKIGLVQSVATTFNLQDALYVAKDGTLTDSPPAIGVDGFVAGDFVIYVGHISRNEATPANKDLDLRPEVIGQL